MAEGICSNLQHTNIIIEFIIIHSFIQQDHFIAHWCNKINDDAT